MSTTVVHNRHTLLRRVVVVIAFSIIGCVVAKAIGQESVPQALWETLKEVVPAFLAGLHATVDVIRSAAGKL